MSELKNDMDKLKKMGDKLESPVRKKNTKSAQATIDPLIGKWFHSFDKGKVVWQGQVIGRINESYYTVQLYEWIFGGPNDIRVASIESMVSWVYYESSDDMIETYESKWQHVHSKISNNSEDTITESTVEKAYRRGVHQAFAMLEWFLKENNISADKVIPLTVNMANRIRASDEKYPSLLHNLFREIEDLLLKAE